jgi:hypothetical protein
VPFHHELA